MDQYVALLKQFVGACNANTDLLHDPRLGFYREYLEKLGANIPPKTEKPKAAEPEKEPESASAQPQSEPEPTPEQTVPFPELDNSGVIEPDDGGALPMGDPSREPSEEDIEKASEERDKANEAFSNGDFDSSLQHYTTAIECNPGSAILHAKRANVLLKLKRPVAAIADCDKAISINPDSAQGYKFRGRANRLLGRWVEAKTDLATACKLDYDETANEWLKEVQPNVSFRTKKEREV
ncbi:unnamed protein product [Caenorhabditis auriculariae]|uniref:Hsp70-interacting protein N-terminal domain-containing protein n=1 Tax=Caenorhabditis auriculariae TaxID=2777116 RepID=A0A8S1GTM5_9PELO|nr:unnamed protein product [Caenorhabditis auriculariae]